MNEPVLFEGRLLYKFSGLKTVLLIAMALLAGLLVFWGGASGTMDAGIVAMILIFLGLPITLMLLDSLCRGSVIRKRKLFLLPNEIYWQFASLLTGKNGSVHIPLDQISQLQTVNRSLTVTAAGKDYTIRDLENPEEFAEAVRARMRTIQEERQIAAMQQAQLNYRQNPADEFYAAQHLMQQGKITPQQFNASQGQCMQ